MMTGTVQELLQSGVQLMILGMGTVFVFLGILVVAVNAMSMLARKFEKSPQRSPSVTSVRTDETHGEIMAVISAAIHRYRMQR